MRISFKGLAGLAVLAVALLSGGGVAVGEEANVTAPPLWTPDTRYDPPIWVLDKDLYNQGMKEDGYGWEPLSEECPVSFVAKWSGDPPLGDVEFKAEGTVLWENQGAMTFERFDDRRTTAFMKMSAPFGGEAAGQGPYVVILYPVLTNAGSGTSCQMFLYTCPNKEDIEDLFDRDGHLTRCKSHGYGVSRW